MKHAAPKDTVLRRLQDEIVSLRKAELRLSMELLQAAQHGRTARKCDLGYRRGVARLQADRLEEGLP